MVRKDRKVMDWIRQLRVGDEVIVKSKYGMRITKIDKINTKTVRVDNGCLFYFDGTERGGGYNSQELCQASPETVSRIRKEIARRELRREVETLFNEKVSLSTEKLNTIKAILEGE